MELSKIKKYGLLYSFFYFFIKTFNFISNNSLKRRFSVKDILVDRFYYISDSSRICISEGFRAGKMLWLEVIGETARIRIGTNVRLSVNVHIAAIHDVTIGNNVLVGSNVIITDHSHGIFTREELLIPPCKRPLVSKGAVIIGDNVWLGNGVVVLSGVSIGEGCVIGANSVVTGSIPDFSVAVGIPARVIRNV
ncbi:acyltransferase [Budviciaceae bacterium CWB-B4]|uniref:Acyltransferase n=1 Tax=Limnobaculum xujianqingii TaxID=2738837 RepID=A0A9D7AL14_9GAMM|nr:DapH/DapD/GlmU-related protein [Limnobaculum xujianqingii]MBK5074421.1 acyltransferase [Limnobaculum xujianqingii]MBK5177913.1 acyltransferase [Limnobaculum xujianqingii]